MEVGSVVESVVEGTDELVVGSSTAIAVAGAATRAESISRSRRNLDFIIGSGTIPPLEFPFYISFHISIGDFTSPVTAFLVAGQPEFDFRL